MAFAQISIATVIRHQLIVAASLADLTLVENHDLVCFLHGCQSVRDHQHGASVHRLTETQLNSSFSFSIQCAGCFIEQQHGWISQHGSGNGNALQLTSGDIGATLLEFCFVPIRQRHDEVMGIGQTSCLDQLTMAGRPAETNGIRNAAGEHGCPLRNESNLLPELPCFHLCQVLSIQFDFT